MRRPVWLTPAVLTIFLSGAAMMSVSMGSRQSQGLLIGPLSLDRDWPLATFSLAVAVHNLMWGFSSPSPGPPPTVGAPPVSPPWAPWPSVSV